jgi:Fe-S-cluster containining protein
MGETSLMIDLANKIRGIYRSLDEKTRSFQEKSGLKCLNGCGQCCLSPTVEAQVSEMLPLAMSMLKSGDAADLHAKIEQKRDAMCVLYRPSSADPNQGYCSAYEMRPSVCRLFGFSAVSGKPPEKGQLSTCKIIKNRQPEATSKAMDLLTSNHHEVPYVRDYSLQMEVLAPGTAFSERLPINHAIKIALEKVALLPPHMTEMQVLGESPCDLPTDAMTIP